ncbi:hypothetical protein DW228_18470 [Bacteroides fragilis]|uniref:Immunity protein 43 domain-containing protein n=2 Tax=Bacteroides fragilis TaxID=817 RepID=A0A396BU51_BACFG|nr:hypothetical protein DW228_18470 [Bacteroides fragilis]
MMFYPNVNKDMRYWSVICSTNPSVTGINNADAQVETLNKKKEYSFVDKNEEKYFVEFCRDVWRKTKEIYIDDFNAIDDSKISLIKYFPTKKRVKEIDVLRHSTQSSFNIFDFLISDKVLKIFLEFNLPEFNIIPAKVTGFTIQYYLIGFSIIPYSKIDFEKSIFRNDISGSIITFHNYDEYKNHNTICVSAKKIILIKRYNYDVLRTPVGLFFSESLITKMKENNVVGFEIENVFLDNCYDSD